MASKTSKPDTLPRNIRGILRTKELTRLGVSRNKLRQLVASGELVREGRGVYATASHDATEKHSLAIACSRVPKGVVCLLSALVFHGITTQNPWEVWMAIDFKARKPALDNPPLRIVRFSGKALTEGIETQGVEGVEVKVYSVAKTVADLFKYRNKVGIDVAVEALRESLRMRRATRDEIFRFAKVCRVVNVIRPYIESLS
jgi:predicted transcriptional regulator of viral defense system